MRRCLDGSGLTTLTGPTRSPSDNPEKSSCHGKAPRMPRFSVQYSHGALHPTGDWRNSKSNGTAAEVGRTVKAQDDSPQGHSASRRGEVGSRPLFGRAPGGLAAWPCAACRGHDHSGRTTWRVACATRRREAATTAPAGRRRTRVAVGPGRPSRVRPRAQTRLLSCHGAFIYQSPRWNKAQGSENAFLLTRNLDPGTCSRL